MAELSANKYPHQQGTWTLTSPDGRQWTADSPLSVVRAEIDDRIPATVRLERIMSVLNEPDETESLRAELEALKRGEFICAKCGIRKDSEYKKGDF